MTRLRQISDSVSTVSRALALAGSGLAFRAAAPPVQACDHGPSAAYHRPLDTQASAECRGFAGEQSENAMQDTHREESETSVDGPEAVMLVERAARQGEAEAQFQLGLIYLDGELITEDEYVAMEWIEKAAAQGHQQARVLRQMLINEDFTVGC